MDLSRLVIDLEAALHIAFLSGWAVLLLAVDLFIPKNRKGITAGLAALGLVLTLVFTLTRSQDLVEAFAGMIVIDRFAIFLDVLFLFSGLAGIALAYDYLKRMGIERGEYYVLLLFSVDGMMLMAQSTDLIMVFLALELLSVPLYIMAGMAAPQRESEEASLKYFLLGAFSTGIVVYGVAMVFGATGTTSLVEIVAVVTAGSANLTLLLVGAALLLIGLGFKVAVVPFHMWTPDVYQGAPTPATAFMAVGAKAGGFAALLRIFVLAFPALAADLTPVIWGVAALTMVLGNVVAIVQNNIKRLLAYSSIAHAGYILMALVAYGQPAGATNAVASALFYMVAYAVTNFAAWAVVIALEKQDHCGLDLRDYAGLGRRSPLLAGVMAVAMLSFTGVPPTLGFVAKFFVFRTVIEGGFVGLALIGVITSLISAYYYLRLLVIMYMQEGEPLLEPVEGEPQVKPEPWLYATALISGAATLLLIIFSGPLFDWAARAVLQLS